MKGISKASLIQAIRGKNVYVDRHCRTRLLAEGLAQHGLKITKLCDASVFVVQFSGQAGALVTAASAVRGSYQISPGVLSKGGVAVKMKSVGHLKKTLYISPACKAEHADFFNLLQRVVARAGCKWASGERLQSCCNCAA